VRRRESRDLITLAEDHDQAKFFPSLKAVKQGIFVFIKRRFV